MIKKILIVCSLLVVIVSIILIIALKKDEYTIRIKKVDDQSPDRILVIYKNKEEITINRIEYLDGTLLCNGYNTTVHFGDIENEKELKVILNDESEVIAKIVKEEVEK